MTYQEMLENAKNSLGEHCKACPICNGRVCKNQMPGPGAKGIGDNAIRNYEKWHDVRVNMDTLCANEPIDMSLNIFDKTFKYPFFAGPVGAVETHYGKKYNDEGYNNILVSSCHKNGIAAFTGDGINKAVMESALSVIKKEDGMGIPTIKPWNMEIIKEKLDMVKTSNAFAVSMDIDGAGLPFLKNLTPKAGPKSVDELKEIINYAKLPFIVKGVMTVKGALKSIEAGAYAILVSNHGGRVLDQCSSTVEVLPEIVEAVSGKIKILVDGGIRSGVDIFKALALGADGVIIARPFVTAVYGGANEGVKLLIDKYAAELEDTMTMCGARSIKDIKRDMVSIAR